MVSLIMGGIKPDGLKPEDAANDDDSF